MSIRMTHSPTTLGLVAATLAMAGCAWQKDTVPLAREAVAVRVPQQQRLIALAVDRAVAQLDFAPLRGQIVRTRVSGVLPHSREDLLDYVQSRVEGRLAEHGARVLPPGPTDAANGAHAHDVAIGVSWGGIDTRVDHRVKWSRVGPYLVGLILGAAGTAVAAGALGSDDDGVAYAAPMGLTGGSVTALWGLLYPLVADFTYDAESLQGRVRLTVSVMPPDGTSQGRVLVADGESDVTTIDPDADTGHMLEAAPTPLAVQGQRPTTVIVRGRQ
jgi:hypothetical protein